ncbi:MAG: aminodeoxychorismate synthase component I [Lentisphaerae bacterium]|nr:aminodeoxychorismate synthase component I [Lentisphaerota bacterium]
MPAPGDIVFVSRRSQLAFSNPVRIFSAIALAEVKPCLQRVAAEVAQGLYAAGFLSYEAAPAFDPALSAHPGAELPLAWFGLYRAPASGPPQQISNQASFQVGPWQALVSAETYHRQVQRIRELIVSGDTYQINYTFPLQAAFQGDTFAWFQQLCAAQQADHCAFAQAGRFHLLSASPELLLKKDGAALTMRPMKGTARRGRSAEADRQAARALAESPKDRAENVMIVDVLRNDLSRVARPGSVEVARLFEVERYPTVWQMTSTVVAQSDSGVPEILAAVFPSGSVTGAPKIRATQIIRELEPYPRGIYCGTIGWCSPDGQAQFNVAIRTVTVDTQAGIARYHVGGGVTYGSSPEGEYAECLAKAEVLSCPLPEFELLESLRWDNGYFLLDEHLDRLAESAAYFDFSFSRPAIEQALEQYVRPNAGRVGAAGSAPATALKMRLLLRRDGSCHIEAEPLKPLTSLRVGLAAAAVDEDQVWLYHKTTQREIYRQALASRPDCEDVILWNRRGELTESTLANLVLELDGRFWTPPVACGLLAGTFRRHLLEASVIQERVLRPADLKRARSIRLINSVRGWIDARWVD